MKDNFNFEDFIDKYSPVENPETGDILFDTDDEYINKFHPSQIWTLIEEDDERYIVSGNQLVNRLNYIITNIPRINKTEEELIIDLYK